MHPYRSFYVNGIPYHYRVYGNTHGWKIRVINDPMLDAKLWATLGKEVILPFYEQPKDKLERKVYYENMATDLVKKYL